MCRFFYFHLLTLKRAEFALLKVPETWDMTCLWEERRSLDGALGRILTEGPWSLVQVRLVRVTPRHVIQLALASVTWSAKITNKGLPHLLYRRRRHVDCLVMGLQRLLMVSLVRPQMPRGRGSPEDVDLGLVIHLKLPVLGITTKLLTMLQVLDKNIQVPTECLP